MMITTMTNAKTVRWIVTRRRCRGLSKMASRAIFAAYKGDKFIAEGTSRELAKALGVKLETVYFYRSPAYARRGNGKNRMVVIRLDD